ncbi:Uncharacterised protein [Bordetella pertussis]|nr:Uncharacterised protein [Bordetella pertussis]
MPVIGRVRPVAAPQLARIGLYKLVHQRLRARPGRALRAHPVRRRQLDPGRPLPHQGNQVLPARAAQQLRMRVVPEMVDHHGHIACGDAPDQADVLDDVGQHLDMPAEGLDALDDAFGMLRRAGKQAVDPRAGGAQQVPVLDPGVGRGRLVGIDHRHAAQPVAVGCQRVFITAVVGAVHTRMDQHRPADPAGAAHASKGGQAGVLGLVRAAGRQRVAAGVEDMEMAVPTAALGQARALNHRSACPAGSSPWPGPRRPAGSGRNRPDRRRTPRCRFPAACCRRPGRRPPAG